MKKENSEGKTKTHRPKRASKYLCVESDQKGPLIYALNLTEKGLQIFMRRI